MNRTLAGSVCRGYIAICCMLSSGETTKLPNCRALTLAFQPTNQSSMYFLLLYVIDLLILIGNQVFLLRFYLLICESIVI